MPVMFCNKFGREDRAKGTWSVFPDLSGESVPRVPPSL